MLNSGKIGPMLFGFFMGVVATWLYAVIPQSDTINIILSVLIGVFAGIALTYFAIYKLVGHAATLMEEDDQENDPDWWKKGNKPPY